MTGITSQQRMRNTAHGISEHISIVSDACEQYGYQFNEHSDQHGCVFIAHGQAIEIEFGDDRYAAYGLTSHRYQEPIPELVADLIECRNAVLDSGSWQLADGCLRYRLPLSIGILDTDAIKSATEYILAEIHEFCFVLTGCEFECEAGDA